MLGVVVLGWLLHFKRRLYDAGWYLLLCQWVAPLGFVAVLAAGSLRRSAAEPWTISTA